MIDDDDTVPDGLQILRDPWPLMIESKCQDGEPHVRLPLPYGSAIMQLRADDRMMEVHVCQKCANLYYQCLSTAGEDDDG